MKKVKSRFGSNLSPDLSSSLLSSASDRGWLLLDWSMSRAAAVSPKCWSSSRGDFSQSECLGPLWLSVVFLAWARVFTTHSWETLSRNGPIAKRHFFVNVDARQNSKLVEPSLRLIREAFCSCNLHTTERHCHGLVTSTGGILVNLIYISLSQFARLEHVKNQQILL